MKNIDKQKWLFLNEKTPHALIQGDNNQILRDLHSIYDGEIDCIYIDPPYNRGDTYAYYADNEDHDKWLTKMKITLLELKPFLNKKGSIWISIDDREMAYLKILCDEVFGREHFVATIIWQKRKTRENRKVFSANHEYILVYAIDIEAFKQKRHLLPATDNLLKRYKNPDNDPRGLWQSVSANVQSGHAVSSQYYEIVSPGGKVHLPPQGRSWIYNKERMNKEIADNNIWFGTDGNGVPRIKKFMSEDIGVVPETLWLADFAGTTKNAKKELIDLGIYDKNLFDTPKPEKLIYNILSIATNPGDIIMDCFLGSGTTTAVAHKMNRNYIGIEISEDVYKYASKRMEKVVNGDNVGVSSELLWDGGGDYTSIVWKTNIEKAKKNVRKEINNNEN